MVVMTSSEMQEDLEFDDGEDEMEEDEMEEDEDEEDGDDDGEGSPIDMNSDEDEEDEEDEDGEAEMETETPASMAERRQRGSLPVVKTQVKVCLAPNSLTLAPRRRPRTCPRPQGSWLRSHQRQHATQ